MTRLYFIPLLIILALTGCSKPQGNSGPGSDIVRLDKALRADSIVPDLYEATDAWLLATRGYIPASTGERDSMIKAEMASRAWQVFGPDIDRRLPSLARAASQLGNIDGFPARIYGIVSPYNQSVVVVDTIVLVALNHYLGADYEGYASMPDHISRNKTIDRLPLDVAEAWTATRLPFPDTIPSPTLLSRMAYEGAILALVSDRTGVGDGPLLLGWTPGEWTDAVAHESEAWKRLVGSDLLFSDNPAIISRLMAPAPASPDISPDAPGRLGRFIGLRMVRASGLRPDSILSSGAYLSTDLMAPYARALAPR